jgi:apolipoprotein N-acyltransferase
MPPHSLGILGLIALTGLIKICSETKSHKRALTYGLIYGVLTTWGISLWVLNLSIIGWLCSLWVGIFPAIFSLLIANTQKKWWSPIWWSSCWVTIEALRTTIIPFGWNPLSSLTNNIYILQNAAWGSQYIISFMMCLVSATLALLLLKTERKSKIIASIITITLLTLSIQFGYSRLQKSDSLPENAVESIPMTIMSSKEPFTRTLGGRWTILENHIRRTKEANSPYLNIWPESMGFALLCHQPAWDEIKNLALEIPGPLLLTPAYPHKDKIYNSSILLEKNATEAQIYKKRFLTPIGEYVPSFVPKEWIYSQRHPGNQNGDLSMLVTDAAGTRPYRIGMLVCLEETLSKAAWQTVDQGADVLISPSNHGDTGRDCALQQERMAQIRAIETCTPLVRIGNIGASNVFDYLGRETWRDEGERMSNVSIPLLKNKNILFPQTYRLTQTTIIWVFAFIFAIGMLTNIKKKPPK